MKNILPGDAQRLLNDPTFVSVWDNMEESIVLAMKRAKMGDLDTHHELVLSLQVVENIRKMLSNIASGDVVKEFNAKMSKSAL